MLFYLIYYLNISFYIMAISIPAILIIDLEVNPKTETVFKLGAYRPDLDKSYQSENLRNNQDFKAALEKIGQEGLVSGAKWLMGHNIIEHDLKFLPSDLEWLKLPVIDTLRLSPLAFPQNPYHRLIKNHKIIVSEINSPLADCKACWTLFQDQCKAFTVLAKNSPQEMAIYQHLFGTIPIISHDEISLPEPPQLTHHQAVYAVRHILREKDVAPDSKEHFKVCRTRMIELLKTDLNNPDLHIPVAYALSWLTVSGGTSVLAPWVRYQFPATARLLDELRNHDCQNPNCEYCAGTLNPTEQLKRYFGQGGKIKSFRDVKGIDGGQEAIVRAGMKGEHTLAILPTGGGKSLCFQLPALNRYYRNGGLTIIVSPLQSLMKDQVDNLIRRGILGVAALNGMLEITERADVLDKVVLGDIGLLFIAPEQFRNKSFVNAIKHRQINGWVFDEAHCLSKWGHDFRPDYLYAVTFIQKYHQENRSQIAPISCFTATAKPDVLNDIITYFRHILSIEFKQFIGDNERTNLSYEVLDTPNSSKNQRIHELLQRELGHQEGGAVVFVARRKSAEQYATFLQRQGWTCEYFHAGLQKNTKSDIQDRFIKGELRIIVATNAFGMGVDKPDIRLVIHAEITGSLENYLQEAGRAGRDQLEAKCVLLFNRQDVDAQFSLNHNSQIELKDLKLIWKKLGYLHTKTKKKDDSIVVTTGEILHDTDNYMSFDSDDSQADTKVKTALAWLERADLVERSENHTRIFPVRSGHLDLTQAIAKIENAKLPKYKRELYRTITEIIFESPKDEPLSTDELSKALACGFEELRSHLKGLEELGILVNDTRMTINLRTDNHKPAEKRLNQIIAWEEKLWTLLQEKLPHAMEGEWQNIALSAVCQEINGNSNEDNNKQQIIPTDVKLLLQSLGYDKAVRKEECHNGSFELCDLGNDMLRIRFKDRSSTWENLQSNAELRRKLCQHILSYLISQVGGLRSKDAIVETSFGKLKEEAEQNSDLFNGIGLSQYDLLIKQALLFMHKQDVIKLNHGMTILRHAMTIKVNQTALNANPPRQYVRDDYQLLQDFYSEKIFQVHVMQEYAVKALENMSQAWKLVRDYFTEKESEFKNKWFRGRFTELEETVSSDTRKEIIDNLNPQQRAIVADKSEQNRLVLAGPGAGKTRVIVHRTAYLLRVRHVDPKSIIVLAFNRLAAREIKRRLAKLVGNIAFSVTVLTYDGMAMRLLGIRYNDRDKSECREESDIFKQWCEQATKMLTNGLSVGAEDDNDRDRILAGFQYILVDEYQDISEHHYNLVSALAGRQADDSAKLTILAVGDDDQNIYAFNGSSNEYIRRFQQDYSVTEPDYLTYNYRSTQNIINAANSVIQDAPERLKNTHQIKINPERNNELKGGIWESIDSKRLGRVAVITVSEKGDLRQKNNRQTQAVINEIIRLQQLGVTEYADFAVLAHNNNTLKPMQAWCELENIPYFLAKENKNKIRLNRKREFVKLREALNQKEYLTSQEFIKLILDQQVGDRWKQYFAGIIEDFKLEYPVSATKDDSEIKHNTQTLLNWLYDYTGDSSETDINGIFLGTVHSAKGLEFKHVFVLDGHWQQDKTEDSSAAQRLYYVAMTRAIETLTLLQHTSDHPWIAKLPNDTVKKKQAFQLRSDLNTEYRILSLSELDMDFVVRSPVYANIKSRLQIIRKLSTGEELQFKKNERGGYDFYAYGEIVARTSKKADASLPTLPDNTKVIISDFYVRYWEDVEEQYHKYYPAELKDQKWTVVIPQLIISE